MAAGALKNQPNFSKSGTDINLYFHMRNRQHDDKKEYNISGLNKKSAPNSGNQEREFPNLYAHCGG